MSQGQKIILKGNSFRFGVEGPNGERSSLWLATSRKNDFYVGARSVMGQIKISLHESGIGRVAVTDEHHKAMRAAKRPTKDDRKLVSWTMPPVPDSGATQVTNITFPIGLLKKGPLPNTVDEGKQKFIIICPGDFQAVEFGIFYSKEHPQMLEGKFMKIPSSPLVFFELKNGNFVSIVARYTQFDTDAAKKDFIEKSKSAPFQDLSLDGMDASRKYNDLSAFLHNDPSDRAENGILKLWEIHGLSLTKN